MTSSLLRHALVPAFLLIAAAGSVRIAPQLNLALWQDEATMLLYFASGTPLDAFRDYSLPNNHMLLSAVLAALWSPADDPMPLRLLMLASWCATLACFAALPARFAPVARLFALTLFAAASVSEAFALQLRGYALSWPFALVAFAACATWVLDGRRAAGLVYLAAALALVAILPSNALVCVLAVGWSVLLAGGDLHAPRLRRAAAALLGTGAALMIYLPHRQALLGHAAQGRSTWADGELLRHVALAFNGDFAVLAPAIVAGLVLALRDRRRGSAPAAGLLLAGVLVGGVCLAVLAIPGNLYPRVLVPLMPLWCLALGDLLARAWAPLAPRFAALPALAGAVALLAVFAACVATPACLGVPPGGGHAQDLCTQFYRQRYHPGAALAFLRDEPAARLRPVMTDTEASWALALLARNRGPLDFSLVDFRSWGRVAGADVRPLLAVAHDVQTLRRMFATVGFEEPSGWRKVHDSGYFRIWALEWPAAQRRE